MASVGTYKLGRTIGEGAFGKVKLAVHKMTGQKVAVKIVDKIHAPALVREIETWRQLYLLYYLIIGDIPTWCSYTRFCVRTLKYIW